MSVIPIFETSRAPGAQAHVLLFALEPWGHNRPLCTLAARMVQLRPQVHVTYFTVEKIHARIMNEMRRSFESDEDATRYLDRIRIIALKSEPSLNPLDTAVLHGSFTEAYGKLVKGEPIVCAVSGVVHAPITSPDAAIVDFMALHALHVIREVSLKPVKVYAWNSGPATAVYLMFSPMRGTGEKVKAEVARCGRPVHEVMEEIEGHLDGTLLHAPGLPPMYDYEMHPQEMVLKGGTGIVYSLTMDFYDQCDGQFVSSVECYEPEGLAAMSKWFAETSRCIYCVGPLLPNGAQAVVHEKKQSANAPEIQAFMDRVLESHGAKTLVYISFGTFFWPPDPAKIWTFLDVLIEQNIPFIMSHSSPLCVVPDDVVAKVKRFGLGLLSSWTPQQTVLAHAATGWFVTHAGHNSIMEAISEGVPMICVPFDADQPMNAAHVVDIDVAYEMFETRSGAPGLRTIHRTGKAPEATINSLRREATEIIMKAFGEDGARKRAKMQQLREFVMQAWSQDGSAKQAVETFLDSLLQAH